MIRSDGSLLSHFNLSALLTLYLEEGAQNSWDSVTLKSDFYHAVIGVSLFVSRKIK